MKKNNTTKKTARTPAQRDDTGLEFIDVTLPNGQKVDLYGDAVGMAHDTHPDWIRLARAIYEICTNTATPPELFNAVTDFLHANGSDIWGKLIVQPHMVVKILVAAAGKATEVEISQRYTKGVAQ